MWRMYMCHSLKVLITKEYESDSDRCTELLQNKWCLRYSQILHGVNFHGALFKRFMYIYNTSIVTVSALTKTRQNVQKEIEKNLTKVTREVTNPPNQLFTCHSPKSKFPTLNTNKGP